jgi:hypothetical protein
MLSLEDLKKAMKSIGLNTQLISNSRLLVAYSDTVGESAVLHQRNELRLQEVDATYRARSGLTWSTTEVGENVRVEGQIAKKVAGHDEWNANVRGATPADTFAVRIVEFGSDSAPNAIMLGLADQTHCDGEHWRSSGYYFYVQTGGLYGQDGSINRKYGRPTPEANNITTVDNVPVRD